MSFVKLPKNSQKNFRRTFRHMCFFLGYCEIYQNISRRLLLLRFSKFGHLNKHAYIQKFAAKRLQIPLTCVS